MRRTQCCFFSLIHPDTTVDCWTDWSICTLMSFSFRIFFHSQFNNFFLLTIFIKNCRCLLVMFSPLLYLYVLMVYLHFIAFKVLWVISLSSYKSQALNADVVLQGGMSGRLHTRSEILQTRSQLVLANESEAEWEENEERRHNHGWKALGVIHQVPIMEEVWQNERRSSVFLCCTVCAFSCLWISPYGWQMSCSGGLRAWPYADPDKRNCLLSHQTTP